MNEKVAWYDNLKQLFSRTLKAENTNVWGSITVLLVSSFTSMGSTASIHTNNNTFSFLVKSSLVKLETSRTVILFPTVSDLSLKVVKP